MGSKCRDIVVIGGGTAGLAAAVAAGRKDADVLVLEKNATLGGNGNFPEGMFAVESDIQNQLLVDARADEYFKMAMEYAHWRLNPRLIRALIDKSGETISWLADMGVEFETVLHHLPKMPEVFHVVKGPVGTGRAVMNAIKSALPELPVEIITKAAVIALKLNDKGTWNVTAQIGEKPVDIETKNIIIATGGFAGNYDMIRRFIPSFDENETILNMGIRHQGDGVKMAEETGAAIGDSVALEMAAPKYRGQPVLGMFLSKPNTLWINRRGVRFADEGLVYNFAESANAVWRQPGKECYVVFNEDIKNAIFKMGMDPVEQRAMSPDAIEKIPAAIKHETKTGLALCTKAIEEIADFIGCDQAIFVNTIKEYNESCSKGYDAIFAKDRNYMIPLSEGPYYVIKAGVGMIATHGGILTDEKMRVLDKNQQPMKGLYAAGIDVGDVDGDTYQLALSGHAFSFSINGGRIAGENAAED